MPVHVKLYDKGARPAPTKVGLSTTAREVEPSRSKGSPTLVKQYRKGEAAATAGSGVMRVVDVTEKVLDVVLSDPTLAQGIVAEVDLSAAQPSNPDLASALASHPSVAPIPVEPAYAPGDRRPVPGASNPTFVAEKKTDPARLRALRAQFGGAAAVPAPEPELELAPDVPTVVATPEPRAAEGPEATVTETSTPTATAATAAEATTPTSSTTATPTTPTTPATPTPTPEPPPDPTLEILRTLEAVALNPDTAPVFATGLKQEI